MILKNQFRHLCSLAPIDCLKIAAPGRQTKRNTSVFASFRFEVKNFFLQNRRTLEAIGTLCCPANIAGKDNEWMVKVKKDVSASIILRAIYLGCTVNMRHLPRMSDDMAKLADNNGAISDAIPIQRLGLGHEIEFKYCEKKR
jgi:hypothetical protein